MKKHIWSLLILSISIFYLPNCGSDSDPVQEMMDCSSSSLMLSILSTTNTTCGENGGSIEVEGISGTGTYKYSLNGGPQQTSGVFNDLPTGIHFIKVRDDLNCEAEEQVLLASGISLTDDVFERIGATCAIAGCHVFGAQSPNFEMKNNIMTAASKYQTPTRR